ncbi:F-box incomplete domain containing protein [Pandoravirus quercus]|uniref:F-box incomplete domain containing protein n=2 Tax=Pandoravirus TaxID=2060084 RepID=A0A2U7U917_9VIRU|nr:F-box incomplete domain containing protein [Pandoravirus quercus]AVK74882.1 F-box incomplete domain containing protein [Pandoravirus quercus]QBZ81068.1 F-box incomplete domain containing protein [Pandoravirus celtis]
MAIEILPHEIWTHVLSYCDAVDVWRLARTCRAAACTALDPVHILGPGYRRAAARLCTGHLCLARLGALVDDDFFEAAEPAPLGIVRDDDCRRAEGADDKAQRSDLKRRVLDGDGWYRVGARRLVETAPTSLSYGPPSLCHLPPSLVHRMGPLAAWLLVDVAAQARRHGLATDDPTRCDTCWLAGDGTHGPGLCVQRSGAAGCKWTWGFWRHGRQVGPGVVITDAAPKDMGAHSAPVFSLAWTWTHQWHCLAHDSSTVLPRLSVTRSITVHTESDRGREVRHEATLVDANGRRCVLVCALDAVGGLVGSLLRLCAPRPVSGSQTSPTVYHDRPWSASEHLDRLWVIEVERNGATREIVAVGDLNEYGDPMVSSRAWRSLAVSGSYATRVIDVTRADRPDSCPLMITWNVDQIEDHVALFASSHMARGRGLRMEMLDLRDDTWATGAVPAPVYSGSATGYMFKPLTAYGHGCICASLDDGGSLAVIRAHFVCGAPRDHCLFTPARGCLVQAAEWQWKYDGALETYVLSPRGRGTVRLASGIEILCEWPTDRRSTCAPRVVHVRRIPPLSPSTMPDGLALADGMVPGEATLLNPLDSSTLDALDARWSRRIPETGSSFLRTYHGWTMRAAQMVAHMIAQSALRFRVNTVGVGPVTVDFAAEDKPICAHDGPQPVPTPTQTTQTHI